MWESDARSGALFSYKDLEVRVPAGHPLRQSGRSSTQHWLGFRRTSPGSIRRPGGRPSRLRNCSALLLQAFYAIRSERQLMEQLDFDLLYHWFAALGSRRGHRAYGAEPRGVILDPMPQRGFARRSDPKRVILRPEKCYTCDLRESLRFREVRKARGFRLTTSN